MSAAGSKRCLLRFVTVYIFGIVLLSRVYNRVLTLVALVILGYVPARYPPGTPRVPGIYIYPLLGLYPPGTYLVYPGNGTHPCNYSYL